LLLLGAGFGISRATAYRYRDEGVAVLAAQAQDLHTALRRAAADGWSHVILDGKLFDCDRLTESTTSIKGETIDAWYSGSTETSARTSKRSCGRSMRSRAGCRSPACNVDLFHIPRISATRDQLGDARAFSGARGNSPLQQ
jgi:hypothetical protein